MTRVADWEEDGMEEGDVREEEVVDHLNDHMNEYEDEDEEEEEDEDEDEDEDDNYDDYDDYDDYGEEDEEEYDESLDKFFSLTGMSEDSIVYMDPEADFGSLRHYSYRHMQNIVKTVCGRRSNMTKMKIISYQTTDSPELWGGSRELVFLDLANQDENYFPGCWWPFDWIIRNPEFLRTRAKTQTRSM